MRVATYTQPAAVTRGSVAALSILVATILLGTTVVSTVAGQFAPVLTGLVTYAWMGLYVLAFLGLMVGQGINWISWLVRYRILLVALLLGSILSVAWSIDARISAERVVHLLGTSLLGIYFGFTVPLLTTLRVLAVALGGIMLASVAAALALPELGITAYEGQLVWSGVTSSKNHLGFWAATGLLLYVTLSDSTRSVPLRLACYLMAGLCLALLAFSQSATSLLAMLVGGSLSLYLFIANRFRLGFVRMAVLAVFFAMLVGFAVANIDTAELVGRTDDLTGRGEVWAQTWKLIMNRPMSGYGYGSIWFPTTGTLWIQQSLTDFTWIVHHAHNGLLQVASEIGLPLALVALLMIAQQVIEIVYCQYQRQQAGTLFVLAFVVAFLVGNYSEARFLVTRELYWVLFIALPISMLRQINLVSDETASDSPDGETADGAPDGTAPSGGRPFRTPAGPHSPDRGRTGLDPFPLRSAEPALAGRGAALVPTGMAAGAELHPASGATEAPIGARGEGSGARAADRAASGSEAAPDHRGGGGWFDDGADGLADRTSRWDEDDGWGDDTLDETAGVFEATATDIDLGDESPGEGETSAPAGPFDEGLPDPRFGEDRFDKALGPAGSLSGDAIDDDAIGPLDGPRDGPRDGSMEDPVDGSTIGSADDPFGDSTGDGTGTDDWLDVPLGGRR